MGALVRCIPSSLQVLDLGENQLGVVGMEALARHRPSTLQELDLGRNQLGAASLRVTSRPRCCTLILRGMGLGLWGRRRLHSTSRPRCLHPNLGNNQIDDAMIALQGGNSLQSDWLKSYTCTEPP